MTLSGEASVRNIQEMATLCTNLTWRDVGWRKWAYGVRVTSPAPFRATLAASLSAVLLGTALSAGGIVVGGIGSSASAATDPAPTSKPDVTAKIVGGRVANRAATPWFLQMHLDDPGGSSLCGATAISSRWAVTAAHCVISTAGRIRIGRGKTAILVNPVERNQGPRYYISRVVVHPGYRPANVLQLNDIALIQTDRPMRVAGLALNGSPNLPAEGTSAQVFGFGLRISGAYNSFPTKLHYGNVDVLAGPTGPCGEYGSSFRAALQLCAGLPQGGIDSCQGDSGGPLIANVGGRPRLVGIVSSGTDCALAEYPGIYTRVSTYAPWIRQFIAGNVAVQSSCLGSGCVLRRGQSTRVTLTNVSLTGARYRVLGGAGLASVSRRAGLLPSGRRAGISIRVTTPTKRCIGLAVVATGTPLKRVIIGANGRGGCR